MPRGNGTGPAGRGRGGGRGRGQRQTKGRGRMGGPYAAGPGGGCLCPACGHQATHIAGQPCNQRNCPKCGTKMTRAT